MLVLEINANSEVWDQALTLTQQQFKTAAIRALNKTARWLRTQVTSDTAKQLKLNVSTIKRGLVLLRARPNQPIATVALKRSGAVIKARTLGALQQTSRGVRTGRKHWDGAFIANKPSSSRQAVFRRRGKARLPIQELHIVVTDAMSDVMHHLSEGSAVKQFDKIFHQEINYLLKNKVLY